MFVAVVSVDVELDELTAVGDEAVVVVMVVVSVAAVFAAVLCM